MLTRTEWSWEGHGRQLDVWISQSEPRTWAAHSIEVAGAVVIADVIKDRPWWGYAFMMGARVGWEVQEARLTDWDVPWWGTAMDLIGRPRSVSSSPSC